MEPIKLEPTRDTPKVTCNLDGTIFIIGRSLTEDPIPFYTPILSWIAQLNAENIEINIQLEYLNTSSSKQIFNLLKLAKENQSKKNIIVKWYYDENDEDGYEFGQELESLLELPFEFYNYLALK